MADDIKYIKDLIDRSRLIEKGRKPTFKKHIDNLTPEELTQVKTHLESEENVIIKAFGDAINDMAKDKPGPGFIEKLEALFASANRELWQAREADTHEEEEKELEHLLDDLPPDA